LLCFTLLDQRINKTFSNSSKSLQYVISYTDHINFNFFDYYIKFNLNQFDLFYWHYNLKININLLNILDKTYFTKIVKKVQKSNLNVKVKKKNKNG
jgi:hypothetical protein